VLSLSFLDWRKNGWTAGFVFQIARARFNIPPADAVQEQLEVLLIQCLDESIMKSFWCLVLMFQENSEAASSFNVLGLAGLRFQGLQLMHLSSGPLVQSEF
jgi:hypothetical protein